MIWLFEYVTAVCISWTYRHFVQPTLPSVLLFLTGSILCFFAAILAALTGTGGGALILPILALTFDADAHRTVPLSKASILGVACSTAVGGFINNIHIKNKSKNKKNDSYIKQLQKGPKNDQLENASGSSQLQKSNSKPGISFSAILVLEPATLVGSSFGVLLNIYVSSLVTSVALTLVCGYTAYKTYLKSKSQEKSYLETQKEYSIQDDLELSTNINKNKNNSKLFKDGIQNSNFENDEESKTPLLSSPPKNNSNKKSNPNSNFSKFQIMNTEIYKTDLKNNKTENNSSDEDSCCSADRPSFNRSPTSNLIFFVSHDHMYKYLLIVDWLISCCFVVFSGGPLALICGVWWQRCIIFFFFALHISVIVSALFIIKSHQNCALEEFGREDPSLAWFDLQTVWLYILIAFLAGMVAASVGIGGGLIKVPLMIFMGIEPLVAVPTSNTMVFFTSSSNVLAYLVSGRLKLISSFWFFGFCFYGGLVGSFIFYTKFSSSKKQYVITRVLSYAIFTGLASMTIFVIVTIAGSSSPSDLLKTSSLKYICELSPLHHITSFKNETEIIKQTVISSR